MPRLKLIEMDSLNKTIYFRKDDKLIAFDADVAIELISDSLDGKYAPVRHGHNTGEGVRWFRCSECGWGFNDIYMTDESNIDSFPNYCPNCGAKMDEVEDG